MKLLCIFRVTFIASFRYNRTHASSISDIPVFRARRGLKEPPSHSSRARSLTHTLYNESNIMSICVSIESLCLIKPRGRPARDRHGCSQSESWGSDAGSAIRGPWPADHAEITIQISRTDKQRLRGRLPTIRRGFRRNIHRPVPMLWLQ